jgi:hypothetical protein
MLTGGDPWPESWPQLFFYFYYEATKEGSPALKTRTVLDAPARGQLHL